MTEATHATPIPADDLNRTLTIVDPDDPGLRHVAMVGDTYTILVSGGDTGHIEALRIVYDPARVSYSTLVERLYRTVDPVDAGGQFCDRGYQYRSAIFVANPRERRIAETLKAKLEVVKKAPGKITTLILPRGAFYPAEDYHQDYYKNPIRYNYYRLRCGRDARLKQLWGK